VIAGVADTHEALWYLLRNSSLSATARRFMDDAAAAGAKVLVIRNTVRAAIATAEAITIEGVRVPFLSLEMLIQSKTTYREQDRADLVRLRDLLELKRQRGDAGN